MTRQQADWIPDTIDIGKPSTARMYDYILGGGHNLEADRLLVERLLALQPEMRRIAIMNRAFLRRAVLYMVGNGVRQFLDLGSGIPTVGNVHEIAQQADPSCRIVYVDIEAVAVAHSQLVLEGNDRAVMLHADITEPDVVLHAQETKLLDFSKPIGLLAITIGHHVGPDRDPEGVFARYRAALAPGSYLAITHWTNDFATARSEAAEKVANEQINIFPRTRAEVLELFGDFELVEPGLVTTSQWHPDRGDDVAKDPAVDAFYAGVARKS
ncbi:MAG TPA: SAM-dependent methyltransferase [Actinophytocola sp.]|uniref:SAM-dependent methyltransferase n=1 Tax=Actinophytocola sp. TaxID=1872138 RepID=UPI002DBD6BD7|nr:SAM-dependent methyltransferase [Actinophytocola sp.]HEU5470506.1 SAM-dependent methyltransferase [Actinophytocola sp.]